MKIYLDENLSEYVADALNLLSKGYFPNIEVLSTKKAFGRGVADEDLIPIIGKEGSILITQDFNIKRRNPQFDLCREYGLSVFFLVMPKNQNRHWEIVKILIEHWEDITFKAQKEAKPFAYMVRAIGKLKKLDY
jgi:PIN like domain